jgi:hypothetical protein
MSFSNLLLTCIHTIWCKSLLACSNGSMQGEQQVLRLARKLHKGLAMAAYLPSLVFVYSYEES